MTGSDPVPTSPTRAARTAALSARGGAPGRTEEPPAVARHTRRTQLDGFAVEEPAASVRVLLPASLTERLVMPEWQGNVFLSARRASHATIRTFTPSPRDPDGRGWLSKRFVHGHGVASHWALAAAPGTPAAISGPGRGYTIDLDAPTFLLAGDETAIPAISQLLEQLPPPTPVQVHIEIASPTASRAPRSPARDPSRGTTSPWGHRRATRSFGQCPRRIFRRGHGSGWRAKPPRCNGSAATSSTNHAIPHGRTTVRGYWKYGHAGGDDEA